MKHIFKSPGMSLFKTIGLVLTLGASMTTNAALLGFGGDSWKEEVLLHDGQKIIVKRSQSYGGRSEVGQSAPIKEHSIEFTLPGASNSIKWMSEYGEDLGRTNFNLRAVHVLNATPYIIAEPNLCLAYNKWGRPNPPYVIFKYVSNAWQRITLQELPMEFKTVNVVLSIRGQQVKNLVSAGFISAEKVRELNSHLELAEHRSILRNPVKSGGVADCEEWIRVKDGWIAPGGAKAPVR